MPLDKSKGHYINTENAEDSVLIPDVQPPTATYKLSARFSD